MHLLESSTDVTIYIDIKKCQIKMTHMELSGLMPNQVRWNEVRRWTP